MPILRGRRYKGNRFQTSRWQQLDPQTPSVWTVRQAIYDIWETGDDRTREPYNRSKVEAGIVRSCHKRPVSTQQINAMLDEIENEIFNCEDKEVETTVIGELVMDKLKKLDEVAYVRFASVYREFKDVNTFMEELGKLLKK